VKVGAKLGNKTLSQCLEDIPVLESPSIAIKIIKITESLPTINHQSQKSRYCRLLVLARKWQTLMLTAEDLACPAAKAALVFAA
jgi:uncharacterized protein (DUF169 family)